MEIQVDEDLVRVDSCLQCRGVWTDWGEVAELHDLAQELNGLLRVPGGRGSSSWKRDQEAGHCPSCAGRPRMKGLLIGAFHVDRCEDCLGLWFDGGELGPTLTQEGFQALLKTLRAHPA